MVVSKNEVVQVLLEGGQIKYDKWDARASLWTCNDIEIGTLRFDTYLQLNISEDVLKDPIKSPFEKVRTEAWSMHNIFKLRKTYCDVVNNIVNKNCKIYKNMINKIWRNK